MGSIAFAVPIREGKFHDVAGFAEEVVRERGHHAHELRSAEGFSRLKLFRPREPQQMLIVYFEADDIEAALAGHLRSDHDYHDWLVSKLEELTEFAHPHHEETGLLSELIYDWHEEHGVSTSEHGQG